MCPAVLSSSNPLLNPGTHSTHDRLVASPSLSHRFFSPELARQRHATEGRVFRWQLHPLIHPCFIRENLDTRPEFHHYHQWGREREREMQQAGSRGRGHFPVKPLADLRSDVVGVESISDPKFEIGRGQRRPCGNGTRRMIAERVPPSAAICLFIIAGERKKGGEGRPW